MNSSLIVPSTGKLAAPAPSSEKTDLVMALREVARAIEQDHGDALAALQALATEMLVYALKHGPALKTIPTEEVEGLIRREIVSVVDSVSRFHEATVDERGILEERLFRLFDPSLAFNEAINRAIERKKAAREEIDPALLTRSPQQDMMWKQHQLPTLQKALRNA